MPQPQLPPEGMQPQVPAAQLEGDGPPSQEPPEGPEIDERYPLVSWPPWTSIAALFGGFVLAVIGALALDIPAALLGVHVQSSHLPSGLQIADTAVQDVAFVASAVIFAHVGGQAVHAWQFGLRPPRMRWRVVGLAILGTYIAFFIFDVIWAELLNVHEKEKLLETLGANEGALLLVLSAALTCVMAPVCEEFLFRGFFFRSLANWRGPWLAAVLTGVAFGAVHIGSAPAIDLVPLGFLGFALCVLYRTTGSLYPCILVHSLNNSIAFASLEGWTVGQGLLLIAAAMGVLVLLVLTLRSVGVLGEDSPPVPSVA